jgi:HAD superfamily hydrolase (TIGR01490 family)
MNLALFDFDGTLTSKDSLGEFLKYSVSRSKYIINMIKFIPYFIMWQTKLMPNNITKEKLFDIFFRGIDEIEFKKIARNYALNKLDLIVLKKRLAILQKHQQNGDRVIIVSASMKCWLEPWCKKHKLELIATELEFVNSIFTSKFSTPNCHGDEKVNRIKQHLNIKDYEIIYAYGDSSGDTQMLALGDYATKY